MIRGIDADNSSSLLGLTTFGLDEICQTQFADKSAYPLSMHKNSIDIVLEDVGKHANSLLPAAADDVLHEVDDGVYHVWQQIGRTLNLPV
jgi:hypothetical protein